MLHPKRGTIITDASFCHQTKAAGYGAWISTDGGIRIRKAGAIKGSPETSTEAEMKAALIGIWYAYAHGVRDMLVQTDCLTVVDIIRGYAPKGKHAHILTQLYIAARVKYFPEAVLKAKHVKGHTNVQDARSFVNRWCDEQAGIAMRTERRNRGFCPGILNPPTPTKKKKPKKTAARAMAAYVANQKEA